MKKEENASVPLKKILLISLIIISLTGISVKASNSKLNTVKIILSNNYEMSVITNKTKVSEILKDNHIILKEDEKSSPSIDDELSENNTIRIAKEDVELEISEEITNDITVEEILNQNYNSIIEKVITIQEEIPFETITKDVSNGGTKKNKVIQNGKNGLKEVTYKIKYQNDVEIEKKELSSKIIKEPVNKIIQVQTQKVTSRSSVSRTDSSSNTKNNSASDTKTANTSSNSTSSVTYNNGKWSYSASELDLLCAITAQECSSSYEGALAVITTACNRAVSSKWRSRGTDPLSQYKAKNQFCYSIDNHWRRRLNGNYSSVVKQAVLDALNGKRNHNYLSFRAAGTAKGKNIGGNVYFNPM